MYGDFSCCGSVHYFFTPQAILGATHLDQQKHQKQRGCSEEATVPPTPTSSSVPECVKLEVGDGGDELDARRRTTVAPERDGTQVGC
jgi:hypothetical protein